MRAADWRRLSKPVLTDGWQFAKSLAFRVPVGWVLHGLLAEDSAANQPDFYLWMVQMPLVVPTDVVDLSWSERFGDSSRVFDPSAPVTRDAIAQAAKLVSERTLTDEVVLDPPGGAENVRMQEARAYGLLIEGNRKDAMEVLGRVLRYKPRYPWEQELLVRAEEMRSIVSAGRVDQALRHLKAWRSDSLSALGIDPK